MSNSGTLDNLIADYTDRGMGIAHDLQNKPAATLADLAKGFGRGMLQDGGALATMVAPAASPTGMFQPVIDAAMGQKTPSIYDQLNGLLSDSPLATTTPAGDLGGVVGNFVGMPLGPLGKVLHGGMSQLDPYLLKLMQKSARP